MADAAGRSNRSCNYIWNSFTVCEKRSGSRDTLLLLAVLGNPRRLNWSGRGPKLLGGIAPMDATYVAYFYGRNPVTWALGCDYIRFPLASTAVLSRTRGGITQFDYRPRAFAR